MPIALVIASKGITTTAGTIPITIVATDNKGAKGTQVYNLETITNLAPVINSQPITQATAGGTYPYDLKATDPNNDPLSYELDPTSKAKGIAIDSQGQIFWKPQIADIGSIPLTVKVSDNHGGSTNQAFNLNITADRELPKVNLVVSKSSYSPGENAALFVNATDNVAVDTPFPV